MNKKTQLNEFSLVAILGSIALFGWLSGFFSNLADKVDAYYHGRSVDVQKALKKIIEKLGKNKTFIGKIDKFVEKYGIGETMVTAIMNTSEVKAQLNSYKNDKDINQDELNMELVKVLTKAMYDEAESRNLINKMDKKIKNTNWD